jgi:hypothetical protein
MSLPQNFNKRKAATEIPVAAFLLLKKLLLEIPLARLALA